METQPLFLPGEFQWTEGPGGLQPTVTELDMTKVAGHASTHARSHKGPFTWLEIIL